MMPSGVSCILKWSLRTLSQMAMAAAAWSAVRVFSSPWRMTSEVWRSSFHTSLGLSPLSLCRGIKNTSCLSGLSTPPTMLLRQHVPELQMHGMPSSNRTRPGSTLLGTANSHHCTKAAVGAAVVGKLGGRSQVNHQVAHVSAISKSVI